MTLEVTCFNSLDALLKLYDEWRLLCIENRSDIYFHPLWVSNWWKHFGSGRSFLAYVVRENGRLVAVLPFYMELTPPKILNLRLARLCGPIHYFAVFRLPIDECLTSQVLELVLNTFAANKQAHFLCFQSLSESGEAWPELLGAERLLPAGFAIIQEKLDDHTLIPMQSSFEKFLSGLSRKRRVKYRKAKDYLEQSLGISTKYLSGIEAEAFLPKFVHMHSEQWLRNGNAGHFSDWPLSMEFYRNVLRDFGPEEKGRFYVQYNAEGRILAAQFCFVHAGNCVALLTARDMSAEVRQLGIGFYAQMERIQTLIEEGVCRIDSGTGLYDHKLSLNAEMTSLHRILINRNDWLTLLRLRLVLRWADLLDLLYYRVWFIKLAPRWRRLTGAKPKPLWQAWIKTRL
ncbi:GNAT family N-acetyltransferase [Kordiimonas sp.]|uniref:GNAT family N-acetyltransferase n=1 Tax=Kordiimonas sp. TaxID=1970157 RepID=UPI003A91F43B